MTFLTVEDINTCINNNVGKNLFHTIDTSLIGTYEFSNIKYDFCRISHTISGNNHIFTFTIVNSNWTGEYYITDSNDNYLDIDPTIDSNTLVFTTTESSVKLVLYCFIGNHDDISEKRLTAVPIDLNPVYITYNELGSTFECEFLNLTDNSSETVDLTIDNFGLNTVTYLENTFFYIVFFKKYDVSFDIDSNLIVGRVNKVRLNYNSQTNLNITVKYGDEIIPANYDNRLEDYCFYLDLTTKNTNSKVKFKVIVEETSTVNGCVLDYSIPCNYVRVKNFAGLINEINKNTKVIELSKNIIFNDRISIPSNLTLHGNDYSINLNGYGLDIQENVIFNGENIHFSNGDASLIQKENSEVTLNNCSFTNSTASNFNNLGSVLYCDIDLDSLQKASDFKTTLTDCSFFNNHSCILHGGDLDVVNCKYRNNNIDYIDKNNPAFLYQTDGSASITGSIFDIDYISDNLCSNEEYIGLAQALLKCGLYASINGSNIRDLQNNNLNFFDIPYLNLSHVFCKYYYPEVEACVYSSPEINREDKSICYCITGSNHVFKDNVNVSRVEWNSENNIRKITWED